MVMVGTGTGSLQVTSLGAFPVIIIIITTTAITTIINIIMSLSIICYWP